jgi:hypothetical protein
LDYLDLRDWLERARALGEVRETKRRTREQWGWILDPNGRPGAKGG